MAEALLGAVLDKLISMAQNEFAAIYGIKGKAEKLSQTLELIKAIIEDAEEKQITNIHIKVWLQQLKDAVYVLDDILDECSLGSLQLKGLSSIKPKNIMLGYEIGNRLKEISRRFDKIADHKNKFLLQEGGRERSTEVAEWRKTSSTIPQVKPYGREDDKEKIVKFLLSQARDSDFLTIYPIVGLGGIGKTTLAQTVFNDDQVRRNFDTRVWICVSENFSVQRILSSIIESITEAKHDCLNLDETERKVQKLVQGKRYLLVLDDVWKKNDKMKFGLTQDKWNKLKCILSCASKGASILVSTRDMEVAAIMGTCQAHHLGGLSEDECWMLFKQYAFVTEKEERAELVAIGKEIVKKCGGSPLAAQALGCLLRSSSEEKEWLEVKESTLWNLANAYSILDALRLSYFHLTPTLRQCFAFCAIFPKDTKISKEDLIHLWIANGFISSRENLEVEDVGNMIWNELYQKSFFQDMWLNNYTDYIYFMMHDLVHDLAQSIMGQECMILGSANMSNLSTSTHHLSLSSGFNELSLHKHAFEKVESLRTFYQLQFYKNEVSVSACFPTHHTLRVLRTSSFNLSPLKSLIHLRYLELFMLEIETLPDSIYSLRKLEILKLRRLSKLVCLPKHLTRLQDLRHLIIEDCHSLSCMFPNIGKLSSLRTLSRYVVSAEIGHSLAELHDLKLGGSLCIEGLENVGSLSEAQQANFLGKKDLHKLILVCNDFRSFRKPYATNPELVLDGLQPHSNLKKLIIYEYPGLQFPTWIGMLTNLVSLQLSGGVNCVQLPSLGKLPYLRSIEMSRMMNGVQYMDDDESYDGVEVKAFPALERLYLNFVPNLERLLKVEKRGGGGGGGGGNFPLLSNLSISRCSKLELPCCIPSLKSLSIYNYTNEFLSSLSGFNGLTSLQTLEIFYSDLMKELPNELFKNLNTLEHLKIKNCTKLECLPEQGWEGLRSLRTLVLVQCCELKSLPDGVRHLTSLELLTITECPALAERCKEGTGEDWDKIAHVPKVEIEHEY